MKEKKVIKKLEQSLNEKRFIRLESYHPDGDAYDGIVIHIGDGYFAIRAFRDLIPDGIEIIPFHAIRGYRDGKFEQCFREILAANGELDNLQIPEWLADCSTIGDVVAKLHENDIWPGIEEIYADNSSAFYLGPITKIKKNTYHLNCYDAAGEWEKEYKLRYDGIFRVVFDDGYTNRFNAYMRAKDAAASVEPATDN